MERTQPVLPIGLCVEGLTHHYVRHGTTTLFAALDVANGQVVSRVRAQHRHQEFLGFLRQIDKQTPPELSLHLIVGNYVTHKHIKVKAWLTQLNDLIHAAHMRWRIERNYQDLKQDLGLGHYEGRGWQGFHHHATLSIVAYGFLMAQPTTWETEYFGGIDSIMCT